ncbi:MAG: peptidoglycan DD-metalloendopeptidase family protein [Bacteroidota bacterium]
MRHATDYAALATNVGRYALLAVLGVVALGLLHGAVQVEANTGGEQAAEERVPAQATDVPEETATAPVQADRAAPAPLVEVAPRSVLARLRMPVEGVAPDELHDSFTDPRSGGRTHHALDIMAPRGTPIRAAASGTLARIHTSARGGKSLYQIGPDSAYVFYYAHLDAFADGLEEGQAIQKGEILGMVGSTGNAQAPHLHFGIWTFENGSLWGGTPVNPYLWLAE